VVSSSTVRDSSPDDCLEAVLERGKRGVGGADQPLDAAGALLQPGEDRIGLLADGVAGLLQGDALVLEPGEQVADALLVGAEGALQIGSSRCTTPSISEARWTACSMPPTSWPISLRTVWEMVAGPPWRHPAAG
jgi:hypothetical protein